MLSWKVVCTVAERPLTVSHVQVVGSLALKSPMQMQIAEFAPVVVIDRLAAVLVVLLLAACPPTPLELVNCRMLEPHQSVVDPVSATDTVSEVPALAITAVLMCARHDPPDVPELPRLVHVSP